MYSLKIKKENPTEEIFAFLKVIFMSSISPPLIESSHFWKMLIS